MDHACMHASCTILLLYALQFLGWAWTQCGFSYWIYGTVLWPHPHRPGVTGPPLAWYAWTTAWIHIWLRKRSTMFLDFSLDRLNRSGDLVFRIHTCNMCPMTETQIATHFWLLKLLFKAWASVESWVQRGFAGYIMVRFQKSSKSRCLHAIKLLIWIKYFDRFCSGEFCKSINDAQWKCFFSKPRSGRGHQAIMAAVAQLKAVVHARHCIPSAVCLVTLANNCWRMSSGGIACERKTIADLSSIFRSSATLRHWVDVWKPSAHMRIRQRSSACFGDLAVWTPHDLPYMGPVPAWALHILACRWTPMDPPTGFSASLTTRVLWAPGAA